MTTANPRANITIGPDGDEQAASFMNATLQTAGPVDFSVATHVAIPPDVAAAGPDAVASYLGGLLSTLPGPLTFEVQVGSSTAERGAA